MKDLLLLRGLPGAGKSSLATVLAQNTWPVFSVDDYFTDPNTGAYTFHFEKNHLSYKDCEANTAKAMAAGTALVIVANTFTMAWELEPYLALAQQYGYRLHVATVEKYHRGSNAHGVTDEQIEKMAAKYRVLTGLDYPPNKRAEAGDVIDDLPGKSVKWLLSQGHIESVTDDKKGDG